MKSAFLCLCVLALCGQALSAPLSGESAEQSHRRGSCGGLVEEPPAPPSPPSPPSSPNPPSPLPASVPTPLPGQCYCTPMPEEEPTVVPSGGPGSGEFHSHCVLIQAFYNFSIHLTVQQQLIWEAWIVEIENTILVDLELSEDEKVVQIALALKHFFSLHVDIALELEYQQIADWGTCRDFVYVAISIQIEITQSVVVLGGADGRPTCPLLEALRNASSNCGCSSQDQADLEALIEQLEALLQDTASYTYEQQLAVVWELCQTFIEGHASLEAFLLQVHIEAYGSLESLLQVCHTYKLIVSLSLSISGTTVDDCALLGALDAASRNTSFSGAEQLQIAQLQQKLQVFFQANVDIKVRLEYVSSQCYQLFKLLPEIVQIIEQVSCVEWGGDIYDLIFCSGICTNCGCGNPNDGPGPQGTTAVSTPSTGAPSTPATSTAAPSTPTTPSTPAPTPTTPSNPCGQCPGLIVVTGQNTTVLTDVLLQNYNSWTLAKKSGFNSCFNSIRKAIWDNVAFPTPALKLGGCRTAFNQYSTNNKTIQDEVFNIQITVDLTVRQFVACP